MADSTAASKVGSSDAKNVNVDQPADVNAFVTPVKKKKRILKKIPSRPKSDINLSMGKLKSISTPKNYSFLNVSVQKQTLRANNRVLAQSLAKAREELRDANNRIFQLHREQQDILQENNRLHRVAGLKDEEIEAEVQKRLQLLMMDMKTNLREISHHMLKSGEILNELHEKCLTYSRPSVSGSRSLSVGNISARSSDGGLHCNTNTRSIYYQSSKLNQPSTHDFLSKADELEMGFSTNRCVVEGHNDMSLIMEQSTLDDTCAELGEMAAIVPLPAVSESAEHPSLQKTEVGLPQRVRIRRYSGVEKADKRDLNGGNLQSRSKHETSKAEYVEKLEKREQFPPKSDELKVRADTSNSEENKSNYTAALINNEDLKEVVNPKKRRETFVVPLSVLQKGENHKNDLAAILSNFEPMEFENIDDETITLVSGSPISAVNSENELKEVPGPSGDGENIKCKRETFYLPNPFKPTKEPIRTPPKISSQEVLAKLIHNQATDELKDQSCANMWNPYPEEEVTTFFNTDMEFTAVIDTKKLFEEGENTLNLDNTSLKDVTKIGLSKVSKIGKLKGSTENKNEESDTLKTTGNDASDNAEKQKKSSKKVEEKIRGLVELRLAKPGKIVFSASRKQPDGRRMPATAKPASKTRLKQKKTVVETPSKESNKISSIFDFHDRTPSVTLEQTDQLKQGKSVYDISLNETTKDEPLPSLKEFKDKLLREPLAKAAKQGTLECAKHVNMESSKQGTSDVDNSTRKGISEGTKPSRSQSRSNPISKLKKADEDESSLDKAPSNEEKSSSDNSLMLLKEIPLVHVENPEQMSENIYYLPLKGGSDDEDNKTKHRGRSKSFSKNAAPESDNKDDIEAPSSRSRSKSRSRLKRAKSESDSDEEWKPSQGRSRSRPRSKKTTLEDRSSVKKESESCRGRSRSRPRPKESLVDSDDEDEAVSLKPSTRSQSRSRSKLILDSPSKEEVINENTSSLKSSGRKAEESDKIEMIEQTAESIIYSLPLKGCSDDETSIEKSQQRSNANSRSLSRSRSKAGIVPIKPDAAKETDESASTASTSDNKGDGEATSSRSRSKSRSRLKRAKNESDSDEEWMPSQGTSRSRPRSRRTPLEDRSSVKQKDSESCRGRSRSRPRPKESLIDSDNEDEPVSLKPSTRSQSRSRSKLILDSPSKEEVINENTSRSKSSRKKAEESNKIELIEQTAESIIYSLPLKGCSDDETSIEKSQQRSNANSRSLSRSRSKAGIVPIKPDAAKETDESASTASTSDNKGDGEATSSRSRSKSRSRLRRAENESDSDEEWMPSQGTSRSRPRSRKTPLEDRSSVKQKDSESCRGRSRSHPRPKESLIDSDNEDEAVSLKPSTRSQSRSRSKLILDSPSKEEVINENTSRSKSSRKKAEESDKIEMVEQTAESIIYSLPLKGCSDDETSIEKSQQRSNANSRSQSRSRSKAGIVPIRPDAAEETDESKRHQGKRVKSCSSQEDDKNSSIFPNLKTQTYKETKKKSIKEKDSISVHEDARNIDVLSHEKHSQNLLTVSPNSIFTDIEVHRIQSDDDLMKKIDKENNLHSSPISLIEEKIHPKVEQILSKENSEKFDHCSIPLDKDCSSGATNSDSDSSMRFVTKMRGESLKMDQIEDKILEVTEENIKTSTEEVEENDSKAVKSSKSKICKSTAKKSRRIRETDTKESTPMVETNKEGKSTSKKENSKDEKENQSLKNIRKRLNLLKYSTSKIILQDCSKKQHANVIESPRGIRRTADGAFEADISCTEEREEDFKKPRRAASAVVSYVLPSMRKKLRREDVLSNHGFKGPVQTSPRKVKN
ncbi:hypothetical protein ACJMK2_024029 [Sinanodonta woodiana]|uniref:Shugoshin C-terminal domain-containing protein n=1 Tax=Sinanodonta woodiana TaxID=1069815 RepID=A0ABD3T620_SINWO